MRALLVLTLCVFTLAAPVPAQQMRLEVRQTSVRVPVRPVPPRASPVQWKETRGPKCLGGGDFAGAQLTGPGVIDLILRDRRRIRAELEKRCTGFDPYRGFYLRRTRDGRVCADRDSFYARSGAECGIKRFRTLTAR